MQFPPVKCYNLLLQSAVQDPWAFYIIIQVMRLTNLNFRVKNKENIVGLHKSFGN